MAQGYQITGINWKQLLLEQTGYECITTFGSDFDIADHFGVDAIRDTYKRAFDEWHTNYKYLTELVIILNWKIHQYYGSNEEYARTYSELWEAADGYACNNLKGAELDYFYQTTD